MPFSYFETYRTEVPGSDILRYPALRGACNVEGQRWMFYEDSDSMSVWTPTFKILSYTKSDDGVIEARVDNGDEENPLVMRFIPLTPEYVRANRSLYRLSDSALALLDAPGMMELLFIETIPEWYAEQFGPPEVRSDDSTRDSD
jgi:hypothetical protein